jgi:hypothetical protein
MHASSIAGKKGINRLSAVESAALSSSVQIAKMGIDIRGLAEGGKTRRPAEGRKSPNQ